MASDDRLYRSLVWATMITLIVVMALFAAWPELDIRASRLFFDAEHGFWRARDQAHVVAGRTFRHAFQIVLAVSLLMLVLTLVPAIGLRSGWRNWAFLFGTVVIGPGLIVNALLKSHVGRARPATITEFGGNLTFSPPLQIVDQCHTNCSFSSGEGALAAAVMICVLVLAWPRVSPRWRLSAIAATGVIIMAASGLRMVMGRHFLSDTLFSALIAALVALALYRMLDVGRSRQALTSQALLDDMTTLRRMTVTRIEWLVGVIRRAMAAKQAPGESSPGPARGPIARPPLHQTAEPANLPPKPTA